MCKFEGLRCYEEPGAPDVHNRVIYQGCEARGLEDTVFYNVFAISVGFGAGRRFRKPKAWPRLLAFVVSRGGPETLYFILCSKSFPQCSRQGKGPDPNATHGIKLNVFGPPEASPGALFKARGPTRTPPIEMQARP